MKKYFSKSTLLLAAMATLAFTACTDEYEYDGPGQPDTTDKNIVYFTTGGSSSSVQELDPADDRVITTTVKRTKTEGELTLPLKLEVNDSNVFELEPVVFADGASEAIVKINFPKAEEGIVYKLKVSIPDAYLPIYTKFAEKAEFATAISVASWEDVASTGYFYDPFFPAVFSSTKQVPLAVKYQKNVNGDIVRYRFNSPYAYTATGQDDNGYGYIGYPYNNAGDGDEKEHKIVIQVDKSGNATMEPSVLGNNWGFGMFEGGSNAGKYGKFANDYINFPAGSLYILLPEYNGGTKFNAAAGYFFLSPEALEAALG